MIAEVVLPTPPDITFTALTDGEVYSRWLQVPVSIDGDRFAATLEWGTEVRGRYEFVIPPQLIVMSGTSTTTTFRCPATRSPATCGSVPDGHGSRVVVHQLVNTTEQAAFMAGAWAMVLGRLKANVVAAVAGSAPPQRVRRRKSHG